VSTSVGLLTLQSDASIRFTQSVLARAGVWREVGLVQILHRQIHLPSKRINHRFGNKIFLSMIQLGVCVHFRGFFGRKQFVTNEKKQRRAAENKFDGKLN
jgi:hypothetical protein